jgi:hypothetical protein
MKWMFGVSPPPNLLNDDGSASMATALMTSHYAFRRDLARFTTALASLDPSRVEAVRDEWRSYHEHLHGHHVAEDTGIFPGLRESLGNVIERLMEDHRRIDPLIGRGDGAFAALPATDGAIAVIAELKSLLDPHLALEEAEVIPHLRGFKDFPAPASDAELALYAEGFAWSTAGIAPDILDRLDEMLPDKLRAALPAARAAFDARCVRVWGSPIAGAARTPIAG